MADIGYTHGLTTPEAADRFNDSLEGIRQGDIRRGEAKAKPDERQRLDAGAVKVGEAIQKACVGKEISLVECSHEGNRTLHLAFSIDRALLVNGCEATQATLRRLLHEFRWMLEGAVVFAAPTAEEREAEAGR